MNRNMAKLAAAAVILIGVFAGYAIFKGTNSVSWAQVRQQVAAVQAVVYKAQVTGSQMGQPVDLHIEAIQSDDYGTRMDLYMGDTLVNRIYSLTNERSHISLLPLQKKYMEMELTEEIQRQNGDPKAMIEAFLQGNYKKLGKSEIDGVAVEGIESSDISPSAGFPGGGGWMGDDGAFAAEVVGRLWVNAATGWPVQVTLDVTDEEGEKKWTVVVNDFQWEAQVEQDAFSKMIPEGYTLMYTVKMGRQESGEQLVDGLKYFAAIHDGKYPAKLSVRDVVGEIGSIYSAKSGEASFRIDDARVADLKYGAQYFGVLESKGKEAVYNGGTVTAADADKVLLRWKLDDGQYRVIFGDLRIEDVSAARLAELEMK
ncbi:MAG: hypothetical protein JW828_08115 [Sedimentisphaerales bacterium]|nr:hypothetical protein [Sedimentisphaerales bacterium]